MTRLEKIRKKIEKFKYYKGLLLYLKSIQSESIEEENKQYVKVR